jgi:hypothetical protein
MQDATPSIAIRNAIPATGYPLAGAGLFGCPAPSESSDEKRRAPVDSSCAHAHLVNPKTGRLSGSDDE